ncbi:hypothetical protein L5515_017654 [Caenorhabditis briggsae]|uniref:Uncharacterized protein n=1 Tax=Caenorhabditis briggsae TaxID=6238 RepID=A0AAE9FK18_CAEBR|nr:hypothetical protein L5515_017654 [Caenorhabditis briggsae]
MCTSSSKNLERSRPIRPVLKILINTEPMAITIRLKIYQIVLIVLGIATLWHWNHVIVHSGKFAELQYGSWNENGSRYSQEVASRLSKEAVKAVCEYLTDPLFMSLAMIAGLSWVLLNFFTVIMRFYWNVIQLDYEFNDNYFVPVEQELYDV